MPETTQHRFISDIEDLVFHIRCASGLVSALAEELFNDDNEHHSDCAYGIRILLSYIEADMNKLIDKEYERREQELPSAGEEKTA